MAVFKYVAVDENGVKIFNSIEAENIHLARQMLYSDKVNLLKIKEITHISDGFRIKVSNTSDLMLITRQMATLIKATIPLDEVLDVILQQNKNSKMIEIIKDIRNKVLEGHTLSDALSTFPRVFNPLYKSMITAGELSGHLGLVLGRLADHIEQAQRTQRKIIQALIYPCVLIFVSLGVIIVLLSAVVPNVIEQFSFVGKELPTATKILMLLSNGVKNNIITIAIISTLIIITIYQVLKIDRVKILVHQYSLRLPIIGNMFISINISRYLRTLTTLHANGVPIVQAMNISNAVLTNVYIKFKLNISVKLVSEGRSLSSSLTDSGIFPPMVLHMIISGERSGKLDSLLEVVANNQEEELVGKINVLMALLEPLIIIVMATFILFVILSILQPILQVNSFIM